MTDRQRKAFFEYLQSSNSNPINSSAPSIPQPSGASDQQTQVESPLYSKDYGRSVISYGDFYNNVLKEIGKLSDRDKKLSNEKKASIIANRVMQDFGGNDKSKKEKLKEFALQYLSAHSLGV